MEQMKNEVWLEDFIKAHWNKKDIIEYFIDALGDNELLGKFISIDQIKEKLNSIIFNVMWASNDFFTEHAAWKSGTQLLIFNQNSHYISEDNIKTIIVHEILHALSTSYSQNNSIKEKCGIGTIDFLDKTYNMGVNEGITQWLAESITGYRDYKNGYRYETDMVYEKLCVIIGRDEILKVYLEDINNIDFVLPNEIFKDSIINKFGEIGDSISSEVTRIIALTDIITNYNQHKELNGNSKTCMQKCKDEIDKIFSKIYSIIIENEQDLFMKVKKIKEYSKIASMDEEVEKLIKYMLISESAITDIDKINIFNELIENGISPKGHDIIINMLLESQVNDEKKLELLEKWNFYAISFEKIANSNFIKSKPVSEQLNFLLGNKKSPKKFIRNNAANIIYDLCVQENIIVDQRAKRQFLSDYYKENDVSTNFENLKKDLEKFRYKKIGEYYLVENDDNYWYDENGESFVLNEISFNEIKRNNESIEDRNELLREMLLNTDWNELERTINDCEKDVRKEQKIEPDAKLYHKISNINNLCIIHIFNKNVNVYEYYLIDENGKMIRTEPRS